MRSTSQQYFYHPDHLGSSSFISDLSGEACQFLAYLPFGEQWVDQRSSGSYDAPYKFSGKELDAETGYNYFGARYYDSGLSVWLSVDPMSDARSWINPYNYCQYNPSNRIDPTGEIDHKARSERKFQNKYNRWADRHPDQIAGLRPDERYTAFVNSKTALGRARHETRWFRKYQKYQDIGNATDWNVEISMPENSYQIDGSSSGSGEGSLDETFTVPIRKGRLRVNYNMYTIPDRIQVLDASNNRELYDSHRKVRGNGQSRSIRYNLRGETPQIRVLINQGVGETKETIFNYKITLVDPNADIEIRTSIITDHKTN